MCAGQREQPASDEELEADVATPSVPEEQEEAGPRVLGPSVPPQALLDAAARSAEEMREEGLLRGIAGELGEALVGPAPPPAMLAELAGLGQAPRILEVLRIVALADAAGRVGARAR